jgi:EmrB/QacA subfamily drug resistance transporter
MYQPSKTSRPFVIASVMTTMFMVAIEATIVSTAMPHIAAELGGLDIYSWVFSAFLLSQTAMTVVFGKLADQFGRKPVILVGIGIFVLFSALAGFAWSMPSLIVFRLLQGVGAGAMQPVAMTLVGDLYPAAERGKVQGYLASVWATSAIIGPLVGGLITRHLSWPWIFWINLPIGAIAALGFLLFLKEAPQREKRSIDVIGAVLFSLAIAALMAMLGSVSTGGLTLAVSALAFLVLAALFAIQERRHPDPMVSFALWRRRPLAVANTACLLATMALMCLTAFLPMYLQTIQHRSAVTAGLALTMMVLGWPAGATISGRIFPIFGIKRVVIVGSLFVPVGASLFLMLDQDSPIWLPATGSLIMGFGMGLLSVCCIVLAQEIVDRSQRGAATASNAFSRNLGNTVGAALFGAVLNIGLARSGFADVSSERLRQLLEQGRTTDPALEAALAGALHLTFVTMMGVSLLIVVAAFLLPATDIGRRPTGPKRPLAPAADAAPAPDR